MAVRTPGTAIMVVTGDQNTLKRVQFGRISNLRSEFSPCAACGAPIKVRNLGARNV